MRKKNVYMILVMIVAGCGLDSMYDEGSPRYKVPELLDVGTAVTKTVTEDNLDVRLACNDENMQLRWVLDAMTKDTVWSPWIDNSKDTFRFTVPAIDTGYHELIVAYHYKNGKTTYQNSIDFYRAKIPVFKEMPASVISVVAETSCTLFVDAEGTGDITYEWWHDGKKVRQLEQAPYLVFPAFGKNDTGNYVCKATNGWGSGMSDTIQMELRYALRYDGNGAGSGIPPVDNKKYSSGDTAKIDRTFGTLTKKGFSCTGWSLSPDGSTKILDMKKDSTMKIQDVNVTLFAQWERMSCRIVYSGNGNSSGSVPGSTKHFYDDKVTIASPGMLVKTGWEFVSWNTNDSGTGTDYQPGATLTLVDSVTQLYARWSNNKYTLAYNGNGNAGGAVEKEKEYTGGTKVPVAGKGTLTLPGYAFEGWNTAADGKGISYNEKDSITINLSNITLYAQWQANAFKLIYNGNGNTAGTPPKEAVYTSGDSVVVAGQETMLSGDLDFTGWNTKSDGTGAAHQSKSKIVIDRSDITLFAQWSKSNCTMTYNGNGNTGGLVPVDTGKHASGTKVAVVKGTMVKKGYLFTGWNDRMDGSGKPYNAGDSLLLQTANVTLFAQWSEDFSLDTSTFTIVYDGSGKSTGTPPDTVRALYGTTITIADNGTLAKTGNSFVGWNTRSDGKGLDYQIGGTMKVEGNDTLYPKWKINEYRVSFDGNGNTQGSVPNDTSVPYGSKLIVKQDDLLARTGYRFLGWKASLVESLLPKNPTITIVDKNVVLSAVWGEPEGMVLINAKGKTFAMGDTLLNEMPVKQVLLQNNYWMDTSEVTQKRFNDLMRKYYGVSYAVAWSNTDDSLTTPAYNIRWYDAILYCNARTKESNSFDTVYSYTRDMSPTIKGSPAISNVIIDYTKTGYQLPTETQWEYACRGGATSDYFWGKNFNSTYPLAKDSTELSIYAYYKKSASKPMPVCKKYPNQFNLYDMVGNVSEMCNDWYGLYSDYILVSPVIASTGPKTGVAKVVRGGNWGSDSTGTALRSAYRQSIPPDSTSTYFGFRCVLTVIK